MYLYVMKSGKYAKIGISNNPEARRAQLQTGSPTPISIVKTFKVIDRGKALRIESMIHKHYSKNRCCGEWFAGLSDKEILSTCIKIMASSTDNIGLVVGIWLYLSGLFLGLVATYLLFEHWVSPIYGF